jgi:hypothetical protein
MRKGFDSLCGIVASQLEMDALSGSVFIFINKKRNQVKLLLWEGDGFAPSLVRVPTNRNAIYIGMVDMNISNYSASKVAIKNNDFKTF